ncbi:MAG TPA: hypothetical protein EYG97_02710 [Arcobacter sp.]|nr:hypothetical protein [Arcobacter sp.]HIP55912.1 hypothetical protein [Arcobacter sp.]
MGFGGIFAKAYESIRLTKRDYDPELVTIDDIELPIIYNSMDDDRVIRDIKTELKTFTSVGYRLSGNNNIEEKEYTIYQIGILLNALKKNIDLKIVVPKKYLPTFIYSSTNETMKKQMSDIIKRFDKGVKKDISEANAREEYSWMPKDAGYILYYLSIYKDMSR